jgi:hypothetical protein
VQAVAKDSRQWKGVGRSEYSGELRMGSGSSKIKIPATSVLLDAFVGGDRADAFH